MTLPCSETLLHLPIVLEVEVLRVLRHSSLAIGDNDLEGILSLKRILLIATNDFNELQYSLLVILTLSTLMSDLSFDMPITVLW